ncbi:MAG: hypothetical protein JRI70_11925 [Deltaproteobacteria bacterium]|nr:hypothetical protein [Deltaproteobacteria bacterium]
METWKTKPGRPLPLGATVAPEGVNFSVFSRHATSLTLVLLEKANPKPVAEIPLAPDINRTGDIWHIFVVGLDPSLRYGYKADGPYEPTGEGHWFNRKHILLDPYARALEGGEVWGQGVGQRPCCIVADDFDWEGDRPLNLPLKDSVIYELHVRGYTVHESQAPQSQNRRATEELLGIQYHGLLCPQGVLCLRWLGRKPGERIQRDGQGFPWFRPGGPH